MTTILVTGAAGYIGSVLTRQLLERKYKVLGFDSLSFGGESLLGIINHPNFKFIKGDLRNINSWEKLLNQVDAVIHLAAIVGDPACAKQTQLAEEVNWTASKNLFDYCNKNENIKNFIFASTCSNYGKMDGVDYVNEDSPLKPVSFYAELKVRFERYLLDSKTRKDFIPTSLRFSTAYGISPRMRFDLTVNDFIKEIALEKELIIYGEKFWRPYCHVEDLAKACILVLEADPTKIDHEVFGVGVTEENYQKKMIADEILKIVPTAKIIYKHLDQDPRDYKVEFSKINKILGFTTNRRVPDGLKEVYEIVSTGIISDVESSKYYNI